MEKVVTYFDPPSGWKYGFPCVFPDDLDISDNPDFKHWLLVTKHYPESMFDLAVKHSRFWCRKEETSD